MTGITARPGQTAFDIALQYYGNIEGIRFLLEDNSISSQFIVVSETLSGQRIEVREDEVINKKVTSFYKEDVVTY